MHIFEQKTYRHQAALRRSDAVDLCLTYPLGLSKRHQQLACFDVADSNQAKR